MSHKPEAPTLTLGHSFHPQGSTGSCSMPEFLLPRTPSCGFPCTIPCRVSKEGRPIPETSLGGQGGPHCFRSLPLWRCYGNKMAVPLQDGGTGAGSPASTEFGSFKGCLLSWQRLAACLSQIPSEDSPHCPQKKGPTCPPPLETSCECSFSVHSASRSTLQHHSAVLTAATSFTPVFLSLTANTSSGNGRWAACVNPLLPAMSRAQ